MVTPRREGPLPRHTCRDGTALAGLVGACDGELPVGRVLAALATLLEAPAAGLAADLLPVLRGLVRDGFLHP